MKEQFKEQINNTKRMATIQEELNDRAFDLKDDDPPNSPKGIRYILEAHIVNAPKSVYKYSKED